MKDLTKTLDTLKAEATDLEEKAAGIRTAINTLENLYQIKRIGPPKKTTKKKASKKKTASVKNVSDASKTTYDAKLIAVFKAGKANQKFKSNDFLKCGGSIDVVRSGLARLVATSKIKRTGVRNNTRYTLSS